VIARPPLTNEVNGLVLHRYWTNRARTCALKAHAEGAHAGIRRWEHGGGGGGGGGGGSTLSMPSGAPETKSGSMRTLRETVEHPFWHAEMRRGRALF